MLKDVPASIQSLQQRLADMANAYYSQGETLTTDEEYDQLKEQLEELVEHAPLWRSAAPILDQVGVAPSGRLPKRRHREPMRSLSKLSPISQDSEHQGLQTFVREMFAKSSQLVPRHIDAATGSQRLTLWAEPKMDGAALRLTYTAKGLQIALSRGDGQTGDLVTGQAKQIDALPNKLAATGGFSWDDWQAVEVTGEVVVPHQDFDELNQQIVAENERAERAAANADSQKLFSANKPLFTNPRNLAASSLRHSDLAVVGQRRLRFLAFDLRCIPVAKSPQQSHSEQSEQEMIQAALEATAALLPTQDKVADMLQQWGFECPQDSQLLQADAEFAEEKPQTLDCSQLLTYYRQMLARRGQFPIDLDGLVLKLNERLAQSALDRLAEKRDGRQVRRAPNWAVAWKFPPEERATQLLKVEFQVSRNNLLTPVAHLQPISVGGVVVSRASLKNMGIVRALDLHHGDWVVVRRAGDVIPEIAYVQQQKRSDQATPIEPPLHCLCGAKVQAVEDDLQQRFYQCTAGADCPQRQIAELEAFCLASSIEHRGAGAPIAPQIEGVGTS